MFKKSIVIFILLLFLLVASNAQAKKSVLYGTVVNVQDGDTITVKTMSQAYKVRLYGIDAPERKQPFGYAAKRHLNMLLINKNVKVKVVTFDKYGRPIGLIYLKNVDINKLMLTNGYAWVYKEYCKLSFCSEYETEEQQARLNEKGLWRGKTNIPPWQWRK